MVRHVLSTSAQLCLFVLRLVVASVSILLDGLLHYLFLLLPDDLVDRRIHHVIVAGRDGLHRSLHS